MRLELKIKKQPKEKKLSTLKNKIAAKSAKQVRVGKKVSPFSRDHLKTLAALWNVDLKKRHRNIPIQGSPERSAFRVVLEDNAGRFFVLEQIASKSLEHKKEIASALELLANAKLKRIHPYLADKNGNHVIKHKNYFWQISPFVKGEELDREKYIFEKWRGHALASFLIDLRRKSRALLPVVSCNMFSLKNYIHKLVREINFYNKDIRQEINNIGGFMEKDFMSVYELLPVAFCHGDYHPLNIIWSNDDIQYVIDWEFCGLKSELYDVANLIGCIGVENPQSLMGDLVKSFITDLRKPELFPNKAGDICRNSS